MTFQQCVSYHLVREELAYDVAVDAESSGAAGRVSVGPRGKRCSCKQCVGAPIGPFRPPQQPRWAADTDLLCCYYDSWRRMELIKRARAHVVRAGFQERLERVCGASADKIDAAICSLGANATVKDVLRAPDVDRDVKDALAELMVFTSDVLGSDGARARLRHEQNGYALMFGGSGGFLTPNVADTRSPLMVYLHGAGGGETYTIDLLNEEPRIPSAREMLHVIARDPVAQARFFILSMRLFLEHVLGTGPFDENLRHNGRLQLPSFPDGFAASGLGGAYGMVAALHGPIEEQARLSIHPHILLWFVHAQSEQWLRSILRRETEEARSRLCAWQERVLAAVQSMQLDSAAVLPLLLTDDPAEVPTPRNTPFTDELRKECRMDGQLEGDVRDPGKRRVLVETEPAFVDHHIRRYREKLREGETLTKHCTSVA